MHTANHSRSRARSKSILRTIAALVMVFGFLFSSAAVSSATESNPGTVDASTIPDVRKPEVAAQIKDKVATDFCSGEMATTILPWKINQDVDPKSEKFATCHGWALSVLPSGFDQLLPYTTVEGRSASCKSGGVFYVGVGLNDYSKTSGYKTQWCAQVVQDTAGSANDARWRAFWTGVIGSGGVAAVDFVANPQDSVAKLANSLKTDSTAALAQVINQVTAGTDFDPNDDWFRTQWAIFSGIGVLVLALMVLLVMRAYGDEKITSEEATHALVGFGPAGLILILFGPALGHFFNGKVSELSAGITTFTSGSSLGFAKATDFNGVASGGTFGPVAGLLIWGLLFLGAWAVLLLFVVQNVALMMIGIGMAIALGFMVHPLWRKRAAKAGTTYLGILLAKPALLLILGFVMALITAFSPVKGGTDDTLTNAIKIFTVAIILLTVGFAPATLFRYMPILPTGGETVARHSSGTGRALVAGAAGGMMSTRMLSKSTRTSSSSQTQRPGITTSSATPASRGGQGPAMGAQANSTAGGQSSSSSTSTISNATSSPTASVPDSASMVDPATGASSVGKADSGTGGAGLSGGRKAARMAGGAVKAVAPVVGGTAKVAAGVALKAALAAANAAASSAQSQAHDQAPNM